MFHDFMVKELAQEHVRKLLLNPPSVSTEGHKGIRVDHNQNIPVSKVVETTKPNPEYIKVTQLRANMTALTLLSGNLTAFNHDISNKHLDQLQQLVMTQIAECAKEIHDMCQQVPEPDMQIGEVSVRFEKDGK